MKVGQQCVRCGAELSSSALLGQCEKCLLEQAQQPANSPPVPGAGNRRFGDYELGPQIGRGGMGVVYQAVQSSLRRSVALKMILDAESESPQARRRFNIEAEAAAKLDHPNIVPIYEVGEHEGHPFLSMKLITGGNLRQKIVSGELCLRSTEGSTNRGEVRARTIAIVQFVVAIARAVDHAHQHGVLHRDLKPGNVLIDQSGVPLLTDFGLAKISDPDVEQPLSKSLTGSGGVLGTPSYMSPEQAAGQCVSAASDTYSLGAVFYEMLTGAPPFKSSTVLETLRLIAEAQPRRPSAENPHIDRDLETICLKCLEKTPAARYQTAAELADDLERWLRQEPIRARPAGLALRVRRWTQRNRVGAALIASLCIGLAAALTLLSLAARRQDRLNLIRANSLHEFNQEIETLWRNPEKSYVHIRSARLAEMAGSRLHTPSADTVTLILATVINTDAYGLATQYAPVLAILEGRMEEILGHPIAIDLRLYKHNRDGGQSPVTVGEVDIQRLGPVRYMQARQNQPGLQLLVRELPEKEGVIFSRKELQLSRLQQVAGRRVAFADTNSTISFLSKAYLARAGVMARDFSKVAQLDARFSVDQSSRRAADADTPAERNDLDMYAHREVLRQVLANKFDIGEASRRHFEVYKHRGLTELHSFRVPPDVLVARPGLNNRLVEAFQRSLCSLRSRHERRLLARLRHSLEGYQTVKDAQFDELRSMLTNEIRRFEFVPFTP